MEWWHIGGLLMGPVQAAYFILNQHLKIDSRLLMLWRGFGTVLVFLPIALLVGNWPTAPMFYLTCITAGLLVGVFDRMVFSATAHYGAGVTSRLLALCLPLAFLLWLLLHPEHLQVLQGKPHIIWLPVALLGTLVSVLMLKRDPLSKTAFMALIPLYFIGAILDVLNKTAMMYGNGMPSFITYAMIVSGMAGIVNLAWPTKGAQPLKLQHVISIWQGGLLIVLIAGGYILLKTSSINSAPNPAFITALNLTGPFWVIIWNKWQQHPDNSNIWAGIGCVASALLLVFATI